jgi:DNA polymerase (family 10)
LLQKVPAGVLEVMAAPGIGAKTARMLYEQLGVHDLASLRDALLSGAVDRLPHFSPRKRERLLRLVELKHKSQRRTPLGLALPRGRELLQAIEALDSAKQAVLCGSARRMQEDVGDLDYLVASDAPQAVAAAFVRLPAVAEVYAQGVSRAQVFLKDGMQVDLKIVPPERWGAGMLYLTGSRAHSIRLRQRAIERGLKLNEYGVWRGAECLDADTEHTVYAALGTVLHPAPATRRHGRNRGCRAGATADAGGTRRHSRRPAEPLALVGRAGHAGDDGAGGRRAGL